jgi:hypothetical protein
MRTCMLLAVTWYALAPGAAGDTSPEEAVAIASRHAGHSLDGARVDVAEQGAGRVALVSETSGEAPAYTYSVDLTTGRFAGFFLSAPGEPRERPLSADEALGLARTTAVAHLGTEAEGLAWGAQSATPEHILYAGSSAAGARHGSTVCVVGVSLAGGVVRQFIVMPTERETGPEPEVTSDAALAIARQAGGDQAAATAGEPSLLRWDGQTKWMVRLQRAGGGICVCEVDAVTGAVLKLTESDAGPPATDATVGRPAVPLRVAGGPKPPLPPPGVGAFSRGDPGSRWRALCVAAGLLVATGGLGLCVARRRRLTSRPGTER